MLKNIKSKYILEFILNHLCERNKLLLVKYNKKFKDKINLEDISYRKFTQIEIEVE